MWDVATGQALGPALDVDAETVFEMAFSPDGMLLAAGAAFRVYLWDVASRQPVGQLAGADYVRGVAFSPDSTTLASVGDDYALRFWDVRARQPLADPLEGLKTSLISVAFSPDGRTVAGGGDDAAVRLWDVASRRPRAVLNSDSDAPAGPEGTGRVAGILGVTFSARGEILASAGEQGVVQLWDLRARRPLSRPLAGHRGWIRGLAFSQEGTLASAGYDRTLRLWDTRGRPVGSTAPNGSAQLAVAASPDGEVLAVAGTDGTVTFWDAKTRRPRGRALKSHVGAVKAVAFSPDGETLASGGDPTTQSASGMSSTADRSARR